VARQWCGHTGKKDNCQAGVYRGYASRRGYTLLDRRRYLPAAWFTEAYRERWRACGIPRGTAFRTKHELAGALVADVVAGHRLRARWVVCDEGYGDSPALLDRWAALGLHYLAEVARDTQGWFLTAPDGQTLRAAGALGAAAGRLAQGASADEGAGASRQPGPAGCGGVGGAGAG
jgi:SRSO17 transposase